MDNWGIWTEAKAGNVAYSNCRDRREATAIFFTLIEDAKRVRLIKNGEIIAEARDGRQLTGY